MNKLITLLLAVVCGVATGQTKALAQAPTVAADSDNSTSPTGEKLARWTWNINGTNRQALVYIPAKSSNLSPVIFAFHGHTGTMQGSAERLAFHQLWPEAVVIYPQGLPTPGRKHDPQGKQNGWNITWDETNRDLKFFDAMFASVSQNLKIDPKRVYVEGSSNGSGFACLLWAAKPNLFAAAGIICGGAGDEKVRNAMKPKPVFHVAGLTDTTVPFVLQKQMIEFYLKLNQCKNQTASDHTGLTEYASAIGDPVETFIHDGGHGVPATAPKPLIEFFKRVDQARLSSSIK